MRIPASKTTVDYAIEAAEAGLKVFPLLPMSKRPAVAWQEWATTDRDAIEAYWAAHPGAGYGVPTGSDNDLVVIDLDSDKAVEWWAERGFAPGAVVSTPSGGRHVYYRTDGTTEVQTNASKLFPGVDTRGEGGYVVGVGSMLPTGTYSGDITDIPDAPDDLIAFLPDRQTYTQTKPSRDAKVSPDETTATEKRCLASVERSLTALPAGWAEGAGWHDAVFRSACWLSRMVNSNDYATTEDTALTLLLTCTPVYPGWGEDKIIEQWESARKVTHGQYADAPDEDAPPLMPFQVVANLLPEQTSRGESFISMVLANPSADTDGARWDRRRQIFLEAYRAGWDDQKAVSLVAGSKAAEALVREPFGRSKLWREAQRAKGELEASAASGADLPEMDRARLLHDAPKHSTLLTEAERETLAGQAGEWWGTRYLDWAASRVPVLNAPYHRMNRWLILSLYFSPLGFIPKKDGPMNLCLYGMKIGPSSSGKSQSKKLMRQVVEAMFPTGDSPNIGGDATTNALLEKLVERDGKPSWFNADEAHGLFSEMQHATWRAGLMEKWTDLYEGRVPMMLRAGKKDISGIDATAHFVMDMLGTTDKMTEVLDTDMWLSGFLPRFVWAIGDKAEETEESLGDDEDVDPDADVHQVYDMMPKQWAAEFWDAKSKLERLMKAGRGFPLPVRMSPEGKARHTRFKVDMLRMFKGHAQEALIEPTRRRIADSVRKCAALVAVCEGRDTVELRDYLIALEQAEEWLGAALWMIGQTTASQFNRRVDDVERFVAGQKDRASLESVYRSLRAPKRETDQYIDQLVAEGRVNKMMVNDRWFLTVKTRGVLAA